LGGQVEGDRQAGLTLLQVRAVELVGGLRRGVTGVGADDPRTITDGLAVGVVKQVLLGLAHVSRHTLSSTRKAPFGPSRSPGHHAGNRIGTLLVATPCD